MNPPPQPPDAAPGWSYEPTSSGGLVTVEGRAYPTRYPRRVVELLVERKGPRRMVEYLAYSKTKAQKLDPLFRYLAGLGQRVTILEPGCSAGHLSEVILDWPFVDRLVSFDADAALVAVCQEKIRTMGLARWEVVHAQTPDFTTERFDAVVCSSMIEHVAPALRRTLVDRCYELLRPGGLFVVLESENRRWPFEYHVIRLPIPYVHHLPPRTIYALARAVGRFPPALTWEMFSDPNTGWWGTTRRELLPSRGRVRDLSEALGYGASYYRAQWRGQGIRGRIKAAALAALANLLRPLGVAPAALLPTLFVAFQKE